MPVADDEETGKSARPTFKLTLKGQTIGRRLFGTVRFQDGETDMTTQRLGHLHDSATWRLPLGLPSEAWQWQHDRSPDEALATAVLQAQHPQTGHSNTGLEPKVAEHDSRQFNDAKFRHWDFSRGWTAQMLREYAALKSD